MSRSSTRQENRISPPSASNLRRRVLHHERQPVRAQVRPVLVDDRGPAVALGEDLEDVRDVGPACRAT